MPRYANVDKLMEHAISLDWSVLKWVNEVDISTAINPNVVERKKGKWIKNNDSDHAWKCSVCGYGYTDYKLSYCYDCGADMRKEI